jgi:hypothetical protein
MNKPNFLLLILLIVTLHCKQRPAEPVPEANPFGRFERWLNGPISKDHPNKQDLDSISSIALSYRDWLIKAKIELTCIKEKKKDSLYFTIQAYEDIAIVTSLIRDTAMIYGCEVR